MGHLLHYTQDPINIWTDHKNLLILFRPDRFHDKQYTIDRLLRWCLYLGPVNYVIQHIPGEINHLADYVSRNFSSRQRVARIRTRLSTVKAQFDRMAKNFRMQRVQAHLADIWPSEQDVLRVQHQHRSTSRFTFDISDDNTISGPLLVGGKLYISEDPELVTKLIIIAHVNLGHRGVDPTLAILKQRFVFEYTDTFLRKAIAEFSRECLRCRPNLLTIRRKLGTQFHAEQRFQIIHFDYLFIRKP